MWGGGEFDPPSSSSLALETPGKAGRALAQKSDQPRLVGGGGVLFRSRDVVRLHKAGGGALCHPSECMCGVQLGLWNQLANLAGFFSHFFSWSP